MNAWLRHSGALCAALLAAPVLAGAALVRPRWRRGFLERLGAVGDPPPEGTPLWVHAASVGEVRASLRLCDALQASGHPVLVSTTTPTGREVLERARPDLPARFAPLDHPWSTAAALRRTRASALILVETELWPSWIAAASRAGIPVAIVSARLSDRSLPRYRRAAVLLRSTWARIAAIGARSDADAERFASLGVPEARIRVTGDLKFDPPVEAPELADDLDVVLGRTPFLLAASTHPGEHRPLLEAFRRVSGGAALVMAPRHPHAVDELITLSHALSFPPRRRSELSAASAPHRPQHLRVGDLLILDTLGELPGLYSRAAGVFVGGTLVPVGGHNVLEPVWAERSVAFGPYTQNVSDAARILLESGAARAVRNTDELAAVFREWLEAREQSPARDADSPPLAALEAIRAHRGSTERSAALIRLLLVDAESR